MLSGIMVRLLISLCLLLAASSTRAQLTWLTSLPEAQKKAQAEDKAILINFTGSDWCIWCIKLRKEVFDEPAFAEFAKENLILLEVDFPHGEGQPEELKEANRKLGEEFGVQGFPTIFLLDKTGKKVARGGYAPGGALNYIALLANVKGINWRGKIIDQAKAAQPLTLSDNPSAQSGMELPVGDLKLKGIIGEGAKKVALINSQTFTAGETTMIKLGSHPVEIRCLEIRDNSVLLQVPGKSEPLELKLAEKKSE